MYCVGKAVVVISVVVSSPVTPTKAAAKTSSAGTTIRIKATMYGIVTRFPDSPLCVSVNHAVEPMASHSMGLLLQLDTTSVLLE
jgi:hypothetical protein